MTKVGRMEQETSSQTESFTKDVYGYGWSQVEEDKNQGRKKPEGDDKGYTMKNRKEVETPITKYKPKKVLIRWQDRIIEATYAQLQRYGGDLDVMERELGSRPVEEGEEHYTIRFVWNGKILWPNREELLEAKGNMCKLAEICVNKKPVAYQNQSFRRRGYGSEPNRRSYWENDEDTN